MPKPQDPSADLPICSNATSSITMPDALMAHSTPPIAQINTDQGEKGSASTESITPVPSKKPHTSSQLRSQKLCLIALMSSITAWLSLALSQMDVINASRVNTIVAAAISVVLMSIWIWIIFQIILFQFEAMRDSAFPYLPKPTPKAM